MLGLSLWFWLMPLFLDGHLPSPRWRGVAWFYRLLAVPGIDSLRCCPERNREAPPWSAWQPSR